MFAYVLCHFKQVRVGSLKQKERMGSIQGHNKKLFPAHTPLPAQGFISLHSNPGDSFLEQNLHWF